MGASNMRIMPKMDDVISKSEMDEIISELEMDGTISKSEIEQLYNEALPSDEDIKQQVDGYLDREIENEDHLYKDTGMDCEEFEWILERFKKAVKGSPDARSFSEYANDLGNINILTVKQVLFVVLCYKHSNYKHEIQALIVDVDPSTIIEYVILAEELLMSILPTAKNVATAIRAEHTIKSFKKFVPGRGGGEMYLDDTFVHVQILQNQETVHDSEEYKKCIYNVQITSNKDGLVLDVGGPKECPVHDMEVLRHNPPNFGKWTDGMKNPDTEKECRITCYTDKGYLSVEKDYPGIISKQPYKKPKDRGLTEHEYKKRISRKLIKTEHAINRLKWFRRMSAVYNDNIDTFHIELQVVTGLTNLHIMLKDPKYIKLLEKVCPKIK